MSVQVFKNLKQAIGNLDPEEIRRHTERPLRICLYAHNETGYRRMEDFLLPPELSNAKRAELTDVVYLASESSTLPAESELELYYDDTPTG